MGEIKTVNTYALWKYGQAKYGASTSESLAWGVLIDWDEDGNYTNEAQRFVAPFTISRGRKRLLKPNGQGFERIPTGTALFTLKNFDGRYDGWNENSPLYPYIGYGKNVKIVVRDLSSTDTTPTTLFTGKITDLRTSGYGVDAVITVYCADGLEYLRNTTARVSLDENVTPDQAMGAILDYVNWGTNRNLDASVDNIRYWWASGNKQAATELDDLANSFLGYFFCTVDNTARFIQRTSVSSSIGTYNQEQILKDISNPQPYETQRNIIRIKVRPRISSSLTTIWETIGDPLFVDAGTSKYFFADYTYLGNPVPAQNVAIDVYSANSNADFTGSNLTTDASVSITDFGDTAKITVTNNGASGFYIKVTLEGNAIYEENSADVTYPEDTSAITNPRELYIDLIWQQNPNVALDLSLVLGQFYSSLRPTPSIKIENRPSLQFPVELFDIAEINIPKIGLIGESLRVGGIEHTAVTPNCQSIVTRLYLEPYVAGGDFMQWDTNSVWNTDTIFGY